MPGSLVVGVSVETETCEWLILIGGCQHSPVRIVYKPTVSGDRWGGDSVHTALKATGSTGERVGTW